MARWLDGVRTDRPARRAEIIGVPTPAPRFTPAVFADQVTGTDAVVAALLATAGAVTVATSPSVPNGGRGDPVGLCSAPLSVNFPGIVRDR
ncbi:hypothetical protein ACWCQK_05770 [Streptomyces sp. NPDC002306]